MKLKLLSLIVIILFCIKGITQINTPNLGFEYNNFSYWKKYISISSISPIIPSSITYNTTPLSGTNTTYQSLYTNIYLISGVTSVVGRCRVTSSNQTKDRYGNFPVVCNLPGTGKHSCKLGNDSLSSVCQGLEYNVQIPPNAQNFNIVFYYATVINDPGAGAHECWEMPFFNIKAFDSAKPSINLSNLELTINHCNIAYLPNLPRSNVLANGLDSVYYSPWTPLTIRVKNMGGRTLSIRYTSSGCSPAFGTGVGSPGSHFGYGYVDFDTAMLINYNKDTLQYCISDTSFSYTPPPGYKKYIIYDSATNKVLAVDTSHPVSSVNTIVMKGANIPKFGSVMKVALVPYAWYGFADTLSYSILSSNCTIGSPSLTIDKIDTTSCANAVNVAVRGKNLFTVSNLKGSVHWDTAYMSLGGIKFATNNINLNFNQIDVTNAANGYLTYNWSDTIKHYIADADPLFTMVLNPKPDVSGGTAVWFDTIPAQLEIDSAIGIAAAKPVFNNGWIILSDTPQIVLNVNMLTCYAGCIPMHYQWYYNGVQILNDTLNYTYTTGNGVYTCIVTYKNGNSVSSNSVNVALPVTLTYFKVQGGKLYNTLSWQTATEINTSHFNIQRSTTGKDFTTIGKVPAKGASEYTFNDNEKSAAKTLYYRLEIVDKDGTISYSEVRELSIINYQLSITPNPAKDFVTISGTNLKQVKLLDNLGRIVTVKDVTNSNTISIPVNHIGKGIYIVQATFKDGSIKTEKVVIE